MVLIFPCHVCIVRGVTEAQLMRLKKLREQTVSGEAKRLREDARLTQPELAAALGVPPSTISLWENGKRAPRGEKALRYAELLDKISEPEGVAP